MNDLTCDVGAGRRGLAAERSVRRQSGRAVLIDPSFSGTTCARVGCMPYKLLIAAGNAAEAVGGASIFGSQAQPRVTERKSWNGWKRDAFVAALKQDMNNSHPMCNWPVARGSWPRPT